MRKNCNSPRRSCSVFVDPDRVKKQAGIVGSASSQSYAPKGKTRKKSMRTSSLIVLSSIAKECLVCFDDISPKNGSALPCGHSFCNDCWASKCRARERAREREGREARETVRDRQRETRRTEKRIDANERVEGDIYCLLRSL